jgi:hypothetical protein
MPAMVYRLKYRKGEPLGLAKYPAPTFTSLPLEARNKIYGLLLISSEPIAVYKKRSILLAEGHYPELRGPQSSSKVAAVTFGLLRVNRMISIEAAAAFYHHNIFHFGGSQQWPLVDPWDPLYSFLFTIGDRNRSYLQYLEAEISRPRAVSKDSYGTISSLVNGSFWMRKVYARDQHARIHPPVHDHQHLGLSVDYVSPAIEAVFRILGSEGSKLQLLLLLEFAGLPETIYSIDGWLSGWSGEVPDHIEQMRRQFTSYPNGDGVKVDVQWKAMFFKSDFGSRAMKIENDDWDVLEMQDTIGPLEGNSFGQMGRTTRVIFRRKSIANSEAR